MSYSKCSDSLTVKLGTEVAMIEVQFLFWTKYIIMILINVKLFFNKHLIGFEPTSDGAENRYFTIKLKMFLFKI
jgi:hypothetical protein